MGKKPVISFIIPAYNEEKYIERTLKSIKNQETKIPYEVIVCDNNSTDKTVKVAKKYADKVVFEKKQGIVFARNTGFKHSKGEFLVHTDCDTVFPNDFVSRVYKIFKSDKYAAFTCGNYFYEGNSKKAKLIEKIICPFHESLQNYYSDKGCIVLLGWCLCTPRKIFEKVGGFKYKKCVFDDLQFSKDVKKYGNMRYFPDIKVKSSLRRFEKLPDLKEPYGPKGVMNVIKFYIDNF